MAIGSGKNELLRSIRERNFLARDFDSFKAEGLSYARRFYPDTNDDFSEASLGGLLLDLAAAVGDNLSFYSDHAFAELDPELAVEDDNIERGLRAAGVEITGAAPAVVDVTFYVDVPARQVNGALTPNPDGLPTITSAVIKSDNGVEFSLVDNVDFGELNHDGELIANIDVLTSDENGNPTSFAVSRSGLCVSGKVKTESFGIGSFVRFRRITLASRDVSEIVLVRDTAGNTYYQVGALTQDVIFRSVKNDGPDSDVVSDSLELLLAPFRFTARTSLTSRITSLTLGGGDADTLEDDIIPDPSDFAIPLFGKKTFARFSLDPNRLLKTQTLGVVKNNTTLNVTYRHGGGRSHNVDAGSINTIIGVQLKFPDAAETALISRVRASLDATNLVRASGGDDPPDINELKSLVQTTKNAQSRVVTRQDLIARIYTMPTKFGRVFRAGVRPSRSNPLASQLFIASRDRFGRLTSSPDTLKKNLRTYLSQFILLSDAIDILDAPIVNIGVKFEILVERSLNKATVLQLVLARLKRYMNVKNFQIDQPLVLDDVRASIYSVDGVTSVARVDIISFSGEVAGRVYSDFSFDIKAHTKNGVVWAPAGGIIECRFLDDDIVGVAT